MISKITLLNSYNARLEFLKLTKINYDDRVVNMRIRIHTANKNLWPYLNDKLLDENKKDTTVIRSI